MLSRRDFLRNMAFAGAATASVSACRALYFMDEEEAAPYIAGKSGMIVRSSRFLDLEMPREYVTSFITPLEHFFVRNHMHEPSTLDRAGWRLRVGGEVEKPLSLSLADLDQLQSHTIVNTLECAGNGRASIEPHVPGIQWQVGAVGTARFSGVRLADLLTRAGVKPAGQHVMFRGLDEVPGKVPPFIRSIPIEKARHPDTLVATHMNGVRLFKHHGFPARALIPGWVGAASCKWLAEVKVLDRPFEGNFMNPGYRLPNGSIRPGDSLTLENSHSLTTLAVKSLIVTPREAAKLRPGILQVRGVAWAGEADITGVDVSMDSGATWQPARLSRDRAPYAWRFWKHSLNLRRPGSYTIISRARDSQGRVQPASVSWNPGGYLNNVTPQVTIHVEA
ncbi:MAG: sulfite oxidase [Acidobacteria bacterium]|nr:sulfite oxidase [Acidobacteriota bacterium]